MTLITILIYLNLATAGIALFRLRPTLFILSGNQVLALRSLKDAWVHGIPDSMAYLPTSLYALDNLQRASYLFIISTAPLVLAVLFGARPSAPQSQPFPQLPKIAFRAVALLLFYEVIATRTILSTSHAEDLNRFDFQLGGAHALIIGMLLYELYVRVEKGELRRRNALLIMLAVCMGTGYLKGQTGFPTGTMVCAMVVLAPRGMHPTQTLKMIATLAAVLVMASLIRSSRDDLANGGVEVLAERLSTMFRMSSDSTTDESARDSSNAEQTIAHILECMNLYDSGNGRDWKSIYLPFVYTFEPSFLTGPLGIERPKEAAWELADFYIHGGGIDTLGELYWNGGYFCTVLVWAFLVWFSFLCDTRWRSSRFWMVMVCSFCPALLMAYGYGFAQVIRGAFNGLLWLGLDQFMTRSKRQMVGVPLGSDAPSLSAPSLP